MLQLRLWEFTGTAFVNLFVFALLLAYLFPLSYTLLSSSYVNQSNNSCPAGIGAQTRW